MMKLHKDETIIINNQMYKEITIIYINTIKEDKTIISKYVVLIPIQ